MDSVGYEPSGLESFESGGASSPSPLESRSGLGSSPLESLGGSRVLAGPSHRCCAPSATSSRTRENIYRCSRYMASENKSTVFIFKWRVFNFCLVVSKEKGNMQRHPDSSGLVSGRFRSSPGANWAREQHYSSGLEQTRVFWRLESARLRSSLLAARAEPSPGAVGLESSPLESRCGLGSSRLVNNTTNGAEK